MSLKKKYKKLLRNPKLFFSDMMIKHHKKLSKFNSKKKYHGHNEFTIVSAVYGVEKYLEDYFESLIAQTLDFKKHIHLIMVDDGSQDQSSMIIKKWQKRYPNNITYIYKENGGQASARNIGIQHVKTKWVTFIDPDDFIDRDCFYQLSLSIDQYQPDLLAMNLIFYIENKKIYQDSHPLKYKFKKLAQVSCLDLKQAIQLSSSSLLFRIDLIREGSVFFDTNIKPSFEDAKFIADYLLVARNGNMLFVPDAKYFYRKREDGSSTLDTSWQKKERYSQIFIYGYLAVLKTYKDKLGYIPIHIQRTVLYDMVWYCKVLLNNNSVLNILSDKEKEDFFVLLHQVFKEIDTDTIWNFELAGMWFFYKVAILETFKQYSAYKNIVYIEKIDDETQQILFSFFCHKQSDFQIYSNGNLIEPISCKKLQHCLDDREFVTEYRCWISIPREEVISIVINGSKSRIHLKGKNYYPSIKSSLIFSPNKMVENLSEEIWLFVDRDTQADDNAEHFYRYMQNQNINKTLIFALSKSSHDWDRLMKEGFNLVDFGSKKFDKILKKSSVVLSSHADNYLMEYFGPSTLNEKKYIFLQHGVIVHDLSKWLNNRLNINLFVTSTISEYRSIAGFESAYKLTAKEVKLTGLARHDSLYLQQSRTPVKKQILVMPTWRKSLVGLTGQKDSYRGKKDGFMDTLYGKHWSSLLNNKELNDFLQFNNYQLVFAPHPNIVPYLDEFNLPESIKVWSAIDGHIQQLFLESEFMITDYSSVAFEMAFLKKMVIYYQFDAEEMFSGEHTSQKGYYEYEEHGFGPIAYIESELIDLIKQNINYCNYEKYLPKLEEAYPYRDGKNCERIYKEISHLLEGKHDIDLVGLESMADISIKHGHYESAKNRLSLIIQFGDDIQKNKAYENLLNLYYQYGAFNELVEVLPSVKNISIDLYHFFNAKLNILSHQWERVKEHIEQMTQQNLCSIYCMLQTTLFQKDYKYFHECSNLLKNIDSDDFFMYTIMPIYLSICKNDFDYSIMLLDKSLTVDHEIPKYYKLELVAAAVCRMAKKPLHAAKYLDSYERHTTNDHECRVEIAYLAFAQDNYIKVVNQLKSAYGDQYQYIAQPVLLIYLKSAFILEDFNLCNDIKSHIDVILDSMDVESIKILLMIERRNENWKNILQYESLILSQSELISCRFILFLAYVELGLDRQAIEVSKNIEEYIEQDDKKLFVELLKSLNHSSLLTNIRD